MEKEPKPKQAKRVFVSLLILSILCLLAAYVYDLTTNDNQDSTRKADILYIASYLNDYYLRYHYVPTLNQINSPLDNSSGLVLNKNKLFDPSSTTNSEVLTKSPTDTSYGYQVSPKKCNNVTLKCTSYRLETILTSGQEFIKTSR